MKNVSIQAIEERVEAPKNDEGVVAFQMIKYSITFYGNSVENTLDTKIMSDGQQVVHNGDGFFPSGTVIN